MLADLHLHTTASDGTTSPYESVEYAVLKGAKAVSITDHDTVAALDDGLKAAKEFGVAFVKGIEISARTSYDVHILGYNIDDKDEAFLNALKCVKKLRSERNIEIERRLKLKGIEIGIDVTADGVGRKNIANILVEKGYAKDVNDAFDRFLGTGGCAYVEIARTSPKDAVKMIRDAGGVPCLAHPKKYLQEGKLVSMLDELVPYGLMGLETFYPSHSGNDIKALMALAKRYKLIATGGSDYHGDDRGKLTYHISKSARELFDIPTFYTDK